MVQRPNGTYAWIKAHPFVRVYPVSAPKPAPVQLNKEAHKS